MPLALELVPLAIASALLPLPVIVTVLVLRSPTGAPAGLAWVGGQFAARLVQGAIIGLLLEQAVGPSDGGAKSGPVISVLLLVLAVLFYVLAARKALHAPDDDAPPPGWLEALRNAAPARAFLLGGGLMAISLKFWVFTLGATGAIAQARLDIAPAVLAYVGFVLLALSLQLALVLLAVLAPSRAEPVLARVGDLLGRYGRPLLIGVGLVFGTVFLIEGLTGLGVV